MYGRRYLNVLCRGAFYERLLRSATPFDAIGNIVNDKVFDTRNHVEIIQSEVRVHNADALARAGKTYAEIRRNRRFPDPALAGGDHYDLTVAHTSPRRQTDSILYYIS